MFTLRKAKKMLSNLNDVNIEMEILKTAVIFETVEHDISLMQFKNKNQIPTSSTGDKLFVYAGILLGHRQPLSSKSN